MPHVLFTAHSDDEVLFCAFSIIRHRPHIVICYPSPANYGSTAERLTESRAAASILGAPSVTQWNGGDLVAAMREYDARNMPAMVFAPHVRASHPEHVAVAEAAREVFGDRLQCFHTYCIETGRVRAGTEVPYEPEWVLRKLRALAQFTSQATHPRACQFFLGDQREFTE